jgi:putative nucleotidyltransferase with HDIG domain
MPPSKHSQGRFVAQRTSKKIHVAELKVGMYISKLDRDWLETPFLMQGFAVESLEDISTVADFCEYVWVDALEENWEENSRRETIKKNPRQQILINKTSTVQENQKILGVYRDAKRITKNLMDEARFATSINTDAARETVDHCVQSVLRNADALVWLSRLRDRDEYTSEHCLNVCINAIAFGRNLGMVEEELQELGLCGLLHDIGKMKIPPEILNKPDKLTPEEFNIMKRHTVYGRNLLMSGNKATPKAVDVAWNHHESLDGSGYPRGLNETGISQYARIVAIVDCIILIHKR